MRRCEKGKPCGDTCIERRKICQVELGQELTKPVIKTVAKVENRPSKPVEANDKGLSKIDNYMDVYYKVRETNASSKKPEMLEGNSRVAKVLGISNSSFPGEELYSPGEKEKYDILRRKIGEQKLNDTAVAIQAFTLYPEVHMGVRTVERGEEPGRLLNPTDKKRFTSYSNLINDFLTNKETPKPEIEKFRGFRASPEHLAEMVEAAKAKESFNNKSVSSWSSSLGIGRKFSDTEIFDKPDRTERVILRSINKRGVPIEFVTRARGEDELLTPKDTNYRYLGYRALHKTGTNIVYHIFDVEELP